MGETILKWPSSIPLLKYLSHMSAISGLLNKLDVSSASNDSIISWIFCFWQAYSSVFRIIFFCTFTSLGSNWFESLSNSITALELLSSSAAWMFAKIIFSFILMDGYLSRLMGIGGLGLCRWWTPRAFWWGRCLCTLRRTTRLCSMRWLKGR